MQIEMSTSFMGRCAAGLKVQTIRLARSADNIAHMGLHTDVDSAQLPVTQHDMRDVDLPAEVVNIVDASNAYEATVLMMKRYVEMEDELLTILA